MKFKDVVETRTISSGYYSESHNSINDEVNRFLSQGWIIIDTYTTCSDPQGLPTNQQIHYVLGITKRAKLLNEIKNNEIEYEFCF
ncbi:hypothetical protein R9X47_16480 [Wukongibacter baidiensis]|uniref:hypothetical protein n=1 Tax=Wukongibacter baidiensis TaxID=1723361 RepID=UPI003D7F542B